MVPTVTLYNGYSIPVLGLGTFNAGLDKVTQAVQEAINIGYRSFDCALRYANEREVGIGLRAKIAEGTVRREDIFVTSKLWNTHHRPDLVMPAIEKTLSDLGLQYLDLYLMHFPFAMKEGDDLKPLDKCGKVIPSDVDYVDTWKAMEQCVKLGLARSIGLSNFNSEQINRIMENSEIKPAVHQIECHPYLTQTKLIAFSKKHGMVVTAHCPLGSPNSNAKPDTPPLLLDPRLVRLSQKYKKTAAQIVLKYLVQHGVIPLPKSANKDHLLENFNIFDFELSTDEMIFIDAFNQNIRICKYYEARDHKDYPFKIEF